MLPSTFRDFAVIPHNPSPPVDLIRVCLSPLQIVGQYAFSSQPPDSAAKNTG
jgi:hypothetical protein